MFQCLTSIYNPGQLTEQELVDSFVVRIKEFKMIFDTIKDSNKMLTPPQHIIIQGQRGSGKTTLLRRIYIEVKRDSELSHIIPIIFSEEQYSVYSLLTFWEEVSEYLSYVRGFEGLHDYLEQLLDNGAEEIQIFKTIESALHKQHKKLILLIDNLDELLNRLSELDNRRLREVLTTSTDFWIIGGSANVMEITYDYLQPFYDFFQIYQLEGLSKKDTEDLLREIGTICQNAQIDDILKSNANKNEALRRLTGGVPRTIVLLYEIFTDEGNQGESFRNLDAILDRVTPLYKHRLDDLKYGQRPIIDAIALNWDKISFDEILKKTRLSKDEAERQLLILNRSNLIDKESIGKDTLYWIRERFLNIWYLMRHGKKNAARVRWLTQFLEAWCEKDELEIRAKKHLQALREGKLNSSHAMDMTVALAETKMLDIKSTRELYLETREYLKTVSPELSNEIIGFADNKYHALTEAELMRLVEKDDVDAILELAVYHTTMKDFSNAIRYYLLAIDKGNIDAPFNLAILYKNEFKDYKKAEQYYLLAIENGDSKASNNLALLYQNEFKDFNKAEQYYLLAIEKGDIKAPFNLAILYKNEFKDYKKAEQYYLLSIDKGDINAPFNLALLYKSEFKDFNKAEQYYLLAFEKGHIKALNNLAFLYKSEFKDYKKAEQYYLLAIENGDIKAPFNLALLYQHEFKDFKKAEQYYLLAIDKGHIKALNNLAFLYENEFKAFKKAEQYYLLAIDKGDNNASFNLALLYQSEFKDFKKAEQYYLLTIDKGDINAPFNLALLYQSEFKDINKAEQYYLLAIEKGDIKALYNLSRLYQYEFKDFKKAEQYYLLAIDKGYIKALNNLAFLYQYEFKDYKKAEQYYLLAIDKGDIKAPNNLALLYEYELDDFSKAEKYYLLGIERGNIDSLNNLAYEYFKRHIKKIEALELINRSLQVEENIYNIITSSKIYLWNNDLQNALKYANKFLVNIDFHEKYSEFTAEYFLLLISRKHYTVLYNIIKENPHNLKDRYKPIYFVLMHYMKDEFPNEYKKMGDELKETVKEIMEKVEQMSIDYA